MRRYTVIVILLTCMTSIFAFQKDDFDISEQSIHRSNDEENSLARIPFPGIDFLSLANDMLDLDLLRTGHFTLGTNLGFDPGSLDDHQSLTFGHPLAKTSYPIFELDGVSYRLDQYFTTDEFSLDAPSPDQIRLTASNGLLEAHFTLTLPPEAGNLIELNFDITNLDLNSHEFRTGFVIDPALGTWGDGSISIESVPLATKMLYESNTTITSIQIDERRLLNTGMRLFINFPQEAIPDVILVDNWPAIASQQTASLNELYDAAIIWNSSLTTLAVSETTTIGFDVELAACDYPDGPYMRSQLPRMLDLFNATVYPSDFSCFTVLENTGANPANLTLSLRCESLFPEWNGSPFFIEGFQTVYQSIPLHIPERYVNAVHPLTLELRSGESVLDVIQQNLYVPATSLSDTGLIVLADSVLLGSYPDVGVRFNVQNANTGQYLYNLQHENLQLWEDQSPIFDFSIIPDTTSGVNSADVIFILDVTGSMGDEIDQVKTNLSSFANSMAEQGIDFRLGMVTFLDIIENVYDFTSDVDEFQTYIDAQYSHGGGDWEENSLEALMRATQFQFREYASRVFIWITDAGYHINNSNTNLTPTDVVNAMLANGVTCHAVAGTDIQVEFCDPITFPTGGDFFDIDGNFLDILLEIADLGGTSNMLVNYTSPNQGSSARAVTLEVHTTGLGGSASISYDPPTGFLSKETSLEARCYPNPFNPSVMIDLLIPDGLTGGAKIYNLKGQLVQSFQLSKSGPSRMIWNAKNLEGKNVAAGLYLVQIQLYNAGGDLMSHELIKIVHTN